MRDVALPDDRPLLPEQPSRRLKAALLGATAGLSAWAAEAVLSGDLAPLVGGGIGGVAYNLTAPGRYRFRRSLPREIVLGAAAGASSERFSDMASGVLTQLIWRAIGGAVVAMVVSNLLPPEWELEE